MNCPACHEPMVVLEHDAVEIDYCVACRGIWLDAGELEILFGDAQRCQDFMGGGLTAEARKEKPRRCPICRRKMSKAVTQGEHPVIYDRCAHGDGLWFDEGELAQVLAHGAAHRNGEQVSAFLRNIFDSGPK